MAMYLLFDSGCGVCTQIAKEVEDETSGKVTHRSLRDPQVQKMLQNIKPDWQWEPMLLQTDENDQPRNLYCGLKMKLQFIRLLGIGKAIYLYKKLHPQITTAQSSKIKQERRHFLQQAGGVALGALTLSALPESVKADEGTFTQIFLPFISSGNSQPNNIDAVNFGILSSEEVKLFLDKAKKEDALHTFREKLAKEFPNLKLSLQKYQILVLNETTVVVNFDVESPTGHSSFELRYDKDTGALLETHSLLADYDEQNHIKAQVYTNEEVTSDISVTEDGKVLGGIVKAADGRTVVIDGVNAAAINEICGCFSACLDSFSVAPWVIATLAAICAVVCACTAGAGCLACAIGVLYSLYLIFAMCTIQCWGQ